MKTSGTQIAAQSATAIRSASMTAADPKSFALLDKSWCSKEIRSMAASTLEFNNSTTRTIIIEVMSTAFSK